MKKMLSIRCAAILAISLLVPVLGLANDGMSAWVKTGNGKGLNVREDPSKNSEIIRVLPYRTQVIVHQFDDGWALVEPADWSMSNPGWVSTSFLVYADPGPYRKQQPDPVEPEDDDLAVILDNAVKKLKYCEEPYEAVIKTSRPTNYVHLRWYPDTNARYIAKYLCDTEITVLAQSSKWAQVRVEEDGYVGFILRSNVEPLGE